MRGMSNGRAGRGARAGRSSVGRGGAGPLVQSLEPRMLLTTWVDPGAVSAFDAKVSPTAAVVAPKTVTAPANATTVADTDVRFAFANFSSTAGDVTTTVS